MVFRPYKWEHSAEIPLRTMLNRRISQAVGVPVYNGNAPRDKPFPYLVLGESTEKEFFTKLSGGSELVLTVHIYTEEDGYDQIDTLKGQLLHALSGPPLKIDANWSVAAHGMDSSRKYRYDATKAHVIVYFRFKMDYQED